MINIHDEILNYGNTATPHMLLYHFNFGWPLVDEGTDILWKGAWKSSAREPRIFKEGNNFRKASPPIDLHSGSGEEVAFIDPVADNAGECFCGFHNENLCLALTLRFNKSELPWLTNWQHWGRGEYVTGLEPGTNPPIGQIKAREQHQLMVIQPGEKKTYDVVLEVLNNENSISQFLKKHQF